MKRVRIVLLLLLIAILTMIFVACGEKSTAYSNGIEFELSESEDYYVVKSIGSCKDSNVIIPPEYNGKPVKSIGYEAFIGCGEITKVVIPDGVTRIGKSAFMHCGSLSEIIVPDSVTSVGAGAFYDTKWYNNQADGFVYIGRKLLYDIKGSYPKIIVIPDDVVGLCDAVFANAPWITSVTIGKSVETIGDNAFYWCEGLTEIVLPDSVTSIGSYAFYNCRGLTSVTIGKGVVSIGDNAFSDCTGLTSITIPDSVTSIGEFAFYGCTDLTDVFVGNGLNDIGRFVFVGCDNISYVSGPAQTVCVIVKDPLSDDMHTVAVNITSGDIDDYAFSNCTGLASIEIPDGVTEICTGAFQNCTGLASIEIPNSVTSIGSYAFYNCRGLTSITIPDSVTSISDCAFSDCIGLTSITIPDSVTTISYGALNGCTILKCIKYNGTKEQWNDIREQENWNYMVPTDCKVICTDGEFYI